MVKKTPAYKNRLRALELERSGGTTNKKKTNKQMNKYNLFDFWLLTHTIRLQWCNFVYINHKESNVNIPSFEPFVHIFF